MSGKNYHQVPHLAHSPLKGMLILALILIQECFAAVPSSIPPVQQIDCTNLQVIKEVRELSAQEKSNVQQAIYQMKNMPSSYDTSINAYDYFVRGHLEAADPTIVNGAHGTWPFLSWHREFVFRFNKEMVKAATILSLEGAQDVHISWVDWSDMDSLSAAWKDDYLGAPASEASFSSGYKLTAADNNPFGPDKFKVNPSYALAGETSGALIRPPHGNGQMGCLDNNDIPYILGGSANPLWLDDLTNITFLLGGPPPSPASTTFSPEPGNKRCERTDSNCIKRYRADDDSGNILRCKVYGGRNPSQTETYGCLEGDVPYSTNPYDTTIGPDFFHVCAEGVDEEDKFSFFHETVLGASLHASHGQFHAYLGGSVGEAPTAPNDPYFMVIHTQVDHIWEYRNNLLTQSGLNIDPFFLNNNWTLDTPLIYFANPVVLVRDTLSLTDNYTAMYSDFCIGYVAPASTPVSDGGDCDKVWSTSTIMVVVGTTIGSTLFGVGLTYFFLHKRKDPSGMSEHLRTTEMQDRA